MSLYIPKLCILLSALFVSCARAKGTIKLLINIYAHIDLDPAAHLVFYIQRLQVLISYSPTTNFILALRLEIKNVKYYLRVQCICILCAQLLCWSRLQKQTTKTASAPRAHLLLLWSVLETRHSKHYYFNIMHTERADERFVE
jgi:hypothetical protein